MRDRSERRLVVALAFGTAIIGALAVNATAKTRVRLPLVATTHAPGASGVAQLVLRTGSSGKFTIKTRHLPAGKSFDIVVNKVKVGTLTSNAGGSGTAKFSTSPMGHTVALGFDPQGAQIAIRDDTSGDDDLDGDMPDNNPESAIGCCLGDQEDGETECEDLTAAECSAEGGTATTATSCLPNPCGGTPPPMKVVCCQTTSAGGAFVDDDPEVECEDDVSSAECAGEGGIAVQATSCEPNPCQPTPPPNLVVCCVSDEGESECEHITASECTADGGTVNSGTSCDPDPCGGGSGGDGGGGD